ncbi:hypothetical protein [Conexibacter sp. SYSU D00693]|uniref:hypothetical protein n=1 Tax=Conexibacter sp. SYSU D00693 TaxID=2812560 RepID=UPI00196B07FD|nr:hypothetical protein [Conexibacter sp. SYSU D00693]
MRLGTRRGRGFGAALRAAAGRVRAGAGVVPRDGLDEAAADAVFGEALDVDWGGLQHAYGPADDVPEQLWAIVVGDEEARDAAWWELWANVHHEGVVHEAAVPCIPVLARIARWKAHPDRVEALRLLRELAALREVAAADDEAAAAIAAGVRAAVDEHVAGLADTWATEPPEVRRAQLWLLTVLPWARFSHAELIGAVLPGEHRPAWELVVAGAPLDADGLAAVEALERWVAEG